MNIIANEPEYDSGALPSGVVVCNIVGYLLIIIVIKKWRVIFRDL
jgi:hypothetical protein